MMKYKTTNAESRITSTLVRLQLPYCKQSRKSNKEIRRFVKDRFAKTQYYLIEQKGFCLHSWPSWLSILCQESISNFMSCDAAKLSLFTPGKIGRPSKLRIRPNALCIN